MENHNNKNDNSEKYLEYLEVDDPPLYANIPANYLLPLSDFKIRTPECVRDTIG